MIELLVFEDGAESRIWVGKDGKYMAAYSKTKLPAGEVMVEVGILLTDLRSAGYEDIHVLFNPET